MEDPIKTLSGERTARKGVRGTGEPAWTRAGGGRGGAEEEGEGSEDDDAEGEGTAAIRKKVSKHWENTRKWNINTNQRTTTQTKRKAGCSCPISWKPCRACFLCHVLSCPSLCPSAFFSAFLPRIYLHLLLQSQPDGLGPCKPWIRWERWSDEAVAAAEAASVARIAVPVFFVCDACLCSLNLSWSLSPTLARGMLTFSRGGLRVGVASAWIRRRWWSNDGGCCSWYCSWGCCCCSCLKNLFIVARLPLMWVSVCLAITTVHHHHILIPQLLCWWWCGFVVVHIISTGERKWQWLRPISVMNTHHVKR